MERISQKTGRGTLKQEVAEKWLEIEKIRPIGFIGKDILAIEKKITDPSEIIKQMLQTYRDTFSMYAHNET